MLTNTEKWKLERGIDAYGGSRTASKYADALRFDMSQALFDSASTGLCELDKTLSTFNFICV
jgi:hypothetical protein